MASEDDFVDGDPFDPEVARLAEDKAYETTTDRNEEVDAYIRRRKVAYAAVFSTGETSKDDLEFVMLDLAAFCRAYTPTFHPTNQKIQDLQEGRREVFQRIMDYTRLPHDTLYIKYTDAAMKQRNT